MVTKFEAIYEAGMLRPLEPLELTEHEQVTLKIADASDDQEFMQFVRQRVAHLDHVPSLAEVRERLKHIPDSFGDAIILERSER